MSELVASWARDVIASTDGVTVVDGVVRCLIREGDGGIDYYRSIDGAHMQERSTVQFAMSSLDRPGYRDHLETIRPASLDALVVDVGGGDGRNALPWLEWGYQRVVVADAIFSGLQRFRQRIIDQHPEWLARILFIEADARELPLLSGCAEVVQSIEALYYLNESYDVGLRECARVLSRTGKLLVSERDYEGGLLTTLLYRGVGDFLAQSGTRDVWDGVAGQSVRSRSFRADELDAMFEATGLRVVSHRGMSAFSLVLSSLRSSGKIGEHEDARIEDVHRVLSELGKNGSMRRCHVVVGEKAF